MSGQFIETSNLSWLSRVKNSFKGMLLGLILFVCAFPLLWWNEGRSIERIKALDLAQRQVVSVSNEQVNPDNNTKLIHVSGLASTNQVLSDSQFGLHVKAIRLIRHVEMYQWDERKDKRRKTQIGGGGIQTTTTSYSYQKKWSDALIDSSNFKQPNGHNNPTKMPFSSQRFSASKVTVGAFSLSSLLIEKITKSTELKLDGNQVADINARFQRATKGDPKTVSTTPLKQTGSRLNFQSNGAYLHTGSLSSPQVGDIRIRFSEIKPQNVSVMGKQQGNSIVTFTAATGEIALLEPGLLSVDKMIKEAKADNTFFTWMMRGVGFILMFAGFILLLRPVDVLLSVLPLLGVIASVGVGMFSLVVSVTLTFLTVGLAWVYFRPIIGGLIMAIGFMVLLSLCKMKTSRNHSSREEEYDDKGENDEEEGEDGERKTETEKRKDDEDDGFIQR